MQLLKDKKSSKFQGDITTNCTVVTYASARKYYIQLIDE